MEQSQQFDHGDLKSRNILLTRRLEAKLIDFCLDLTMTAGVWHTIWAAPEILEGKRHLLLLSEVDTLKTSFHGIKSFDGKKEKSFRVLQMVIVETKFIGRLSISNLPRQCDLLST
ncbi:LOW QUALITY PROTEIN: TKL/DRK protein kinase [Phytophthora palmivora]|uniref:TKL/DRK protein kinase n=1 Tax=Phytophthora palmivora TaxID=4796 RepID=A0A2P4XM17_9STRA|nr:LOW QUALITY PROTEIN: TKL/DRK protein kinase [Phytophthora palmivora]